MIWNTSFVFIRHRERDNGAVIFALNECPLYWFDRLLYHHFEDMLLIRRTKRVSNLTWKEEENEENFAFGVKEFCLCRILRGIRRKKKKNFAFGMRKFCVWEEYEAGGVGVGSIYIPRGNVSSSSSWKRYLTLFISKASHCLVSAVWVTRFGVLSIYFLS